MALGTPLHGSLRKARYLPSPDPPISRVSSLAELPCCDKVRRWKGVRCKGRFVLDPRLGII